MFLSSIIVFVVLKKLTAPEISEDVEENGSANRNTATEPAADEDDTGYTSEQYVILKRTGLTLQQFHLK